MKNILSSSIKMLLGNSVLIGFFKMMRKKKLKHWRVGTHLSEIYENLISSYN